MIKELAKYIENNTSLTVGTDLFEGRRPPDIEGISVLVQRPVPGIRNPYPGITDFGQTPFTIQVRGDVDDGYFTTEAVANTVFDLLHGSSQVSLPVVDAGPRYIVNIDCDEPYYPGDDERTRKQFLINLMVMSQVEG